MKWLIAAGLLVLSHTAGAEDIRVVGGKRIDLDALGTNSPWRDLRIDAITSVGAMPKVSVTVEGEPRTIHVKNLPPAIVKAFAEPIRLAGEVVKLEKYVEAEGQRLRRAGANTPAIATTGTDGGEQIRSYNNAVVNLDESRDRLEKLREQLAAANAKAADNSVERAYFTGQKYAGLEIWDCGVKPQSRR